MGLLIDFLEHEVLESALFHHDGVPGDMLHVPRNGLALKIRHLHPCGRNYRQIAVMEKEQIARMGKQGGHVGSYKKFAISQTDDQGRTIARRHNLVRLFGGDYRQSKDARKLFYSV